MARRKDKYYVPKRRKVELTDNSRYLIAFNNKIRSLIKGPLKVSYKQDSYQWRVKRINTIPGSLVRKAVNCKDTFLKIFGTENGINIGHIAEEVLLSLFRVHIKKGSQIIAQDNPWLSATPDGFCNYTQLPIEIKTSLKGGVKEIITKHYYQYNSPYSVQIRIP